MGATAGTAEDALPQPVIMEIYYFYIEVLFLLYILFSHIYIHISVYVLKGRGMMFRRAHYTKGVKISRARRALAGAGAEANWRRDVAGQL